ncbi:MAG: leucine-rich repeat domain-containing protein, partial [Tissierellia bacterium]|nr:leucine-rich repeat domain-containing protein [Tissierellia bacterium]
MKAIKRILALALVLGMVPWGTSPVLAQGDLAINETHFPDAKFRDYVSEVLDENHDGSLSPAEVEAVKEIVVFRKGITDLKGVQYFKNLEELNCLENKISSLDLRDNTKLKRLDCDKNKLTSLDVSKNPDLIYLSCINNSLTSLSVSANPQLAGFYCDENSLTSLDVSKNPDLLYFSCSNNNLASLSLRANTKLAGLYCDDNRLTSLDLSHNPALISLACHLNELETLDLSKNPDLEDLSCHNNKLKDLDLRNNPKLMELMCSENQLTSLDVSHNPELDHLDCYANQLTSLDVSQNPALRYLDCYGNQLTSLDLANNLNIAEEDFSGGGQEYELRVYNKTLSFDPAQLDGTFDLARTRDWAGASPVGTLVKLDSEEVDRITYTYEAGEDKDLKVSLYISYSQDPVSPSDDKPVSKAKAVVSLIIGSPRLETDQDGTKTTSTMEVAPYIKEGRTMLPVRYVAQALGFEVDWNEAS